MLGRRTVHEDSHLLAESPAMGAADDLLLQTHHPGLTFPLEWGRHVIGEGMG